MEDAIALPYMTFSLIWPNLSQVKTFLPVNGSIRILQVINARMITRGTILLFSKTTEDASPSCSLIISTLHFLKVFDI